MEMPFGMHKHKNMEDVPASYLLWLYGDGLKPGSVRDYIEKNKAGLEKQVADGIGDQ